MSFRLDPELVARWQRLAERQREHLLSIRDKRRVPDSEALEALISAAERNISGWAALAATADGRDSAPEEKPKQDVSPYAVDFRWVASADGQSHDRVD
jgi:predicted transcriptional regulator